MNRSGNQAATPGDAAGCLQWLEFRHSHGGTGQRCHIDYADSHAAAEVSRLTGYEHHYTDGGPKGRLLSGQMREYGENPVASMRRWRDRHGDFVPIRFGPLRAHVAFGPAEIEEVLVERAADFRKSFGTRMLIPFARSRPADGRGRRVAKASPAGVAGLPPRTASRATRRTMARYAQDQVDWLDRGPDSRPARRDDGADAPDRRPYAVRHRRHRPHRGIARIGTSIQDFYYLRFASLRFLIPTWLPTPGNRRLAAATRRLDDVVYGIIRERRPDEDRGDLLSMLLLARDEQGNGMSETQVRDEVMTLLLAGHETTALVLSWAFLLLDRNPEARDRLEAELGTVLGDDPASPGDVAALPFAQAVVNETLRLYPPAYVTGREAIRDTTIGGMQIPKRYIVLISMYTTHRDPRFFPEPDAFRPERWLDGLEKRLPRGAFIPFGLGSRKCIGASFAKMEATLLLATIARRWRFELAPGDIPTHPSITLRPAAALPGRMRRRRPTLTGPTQSPPSGSRRRHRGSS